LATFEALGPDARADGVAHTTTFRPRLPVVSIGGAKPSADKPSYADFIEVSVSLRSLAEGLRRACGFTFVANCANRRMQWLKTPLPRRHHHRAQPGNVSVRPIQLGIAVAPSLPHELQRMRGPKDSTVASSGQSSILTGRSWPQCTRVANKPRTPCRRMPPSVVGRVGSSSLTMPQLRTHRERNQVTVIGSRTGTNALLSGSRL
jgi:hypothetical protein